MARIWDKVKQQWVEILVASDITIADLSDSIESQDVEGALQELASYKTQVTSSIDELSANAELMQEDIDWLKKYGGGGSGGGTGGGGGGASCYISSSLSENLMVSTDHSLMLDLDFSSPNIGAGTIKVSIDDVEVLSARLKQGETVTEITPDKFKRGTNKLSVYVVDRVGRMSNVLVFYVRYGGLEFESTFDSDSAYDKGSSIRYYFTPSALDTSLPLTFCIEVDGVLDSIACVSDVRASYTFSSSLVVGRHKCKAWITDGSNKSTAKEFNLIILDDTSIVVSSNTGSVTVEEGAQIVLDYKVFKKGDSIFNTKIYIDDKLKSTGTCNLETQYYRNSTLLEGTHHIKLVVSDVSNKVSDFITWIITVTASEYELIQPATSGAVFLATARNRSNADENREVWQGEDQDGHKIDTILNNFTFNSENGWIEDALVISGDSGVEIPISPLADNAKYGFSLDIEFVTKSIGVENSEVLSIWDDTKNVGIKITLEEAIIKSTENEKRLYFSENENMSIMFVIDRNEKTAKILLNGVVSGGFALGDYVADGVPHLEDFTTNSHVYLGGKNTNGYCEIKNIRIYSLALSTNEQMNNYLSNITDKSKQKELSIFQRGDTLPTLTVTGDFSGLGKDDKKPCDIVYQPVDVTTQGEAFRLEGKYSMLQYQGTSSMQYPIKNYRLNPRNEKGKVKLDPFHNGYKESRFTLKADQASSGHWQNTGLAKWVNDKLYHYDVNDEKSMNPKKWYDLQHGGKLTDTRETINGFPCRLILVNDGTNTLQEGQQEPTPGNTKDMGVFNFNNDKSNTNTLGFDTENFPFCASFEVASNSDTSAGAFMSYKYYSLPWVSNQSWLNVCPISRERFLNKTNYITEIKNMKTLEVYSGKANGDYISGEIASKKENQDNFTFTCSQNTDYPYLLFYVYPNQDENGKYQLDDMSFKINGDLIHIPSTNTDTLIAYDYFPTISNTKDELTYIKDSFELRFPDEDDVGEDYGFLDMNGDATKGLKRVIDFVDKSSDADFVAHFEEYFNKQYTFRYFLLVMALGMVDNLGKNMMLDTWDGQIFYPRFYDMDTICSFNNSGVITFDTDIEMAQGYWNTSNSRLWTRVRDLFHPELVAIYKDMRQYGLSYDNLMHYFYDEQIALIPEAYYNKDYDVKYAPYANQYMGMANGSSYEHLKRWLKRRLLFTDTLYDYVPSYADSITIRANTTQEMRIEIETYAPVYQHMSWYNNQMDKKKIDGKTAVVFTGKAQAATDQEVLIYGGSNIKRIRGIATMNPDSMVIGNASKLVELDCAGSPILTDINQSKANLSPNIYLTKVDISNCPLLGGTLRLNNSPLLSEVNAQGTAITGMLLPTSIKNLSKLKVPKGVTELTLNDAKTLTELNLEKGYLLKTLSLSNCNKLKSFDLSKVKNISLDNSYNAEELRLSTNEQVNLKNMLTLKRLVYIPNNESEDFNLTALKNSPNVIVTTFNCPKLKDFITTAPQRISYGKSDDTIYPYKLFMANKLDLSGTQLETVKFLCTTDVFDLKLPKTVKNFYCDSAFDLDTKKITDGAYDTIHSDLIKPYTEEYNENVHLYKHTVLDFDKLGSNKTLGLLDGGASDWIATSDFIPIKSSSSFTFRIYEAETSVSVLGYNKNKEKIMDYLPYNNGISKPAQTWKYTTTSNICYIRIQGGFAYKQTLEGEFAWNSPSIIPTSANGSLLFNINQNTPKNNSPYIWDLQGMKLNDFHTFGVNNKVRLSSDSITKKVKEKVNWITLDQLNSENNTFVKGSQVTLIPIKINGSIKVMTDHDYTGNPIVIYRICDEQGNVLSRQINSPKQTLTFNNDGKYLSILVPFEGISKYKFKIVLNDNIVITQEDLKSKPLDSINEYIAQREDLVNMVTSLYTDRGLITMPKRLADYKVQIKNADITPNQYNTMLYPKLVDTTLPITGKLDYSKYKGKYLSWAFAYTTNDVVRTPLDSRKQGQIINDYNKLYGTDYIDIVDVWAYKGDDFSNRATNNNITKAYIELTQDNYRSRIDEVLKWYPNCIELYLFEDGSVVNLMGMFGTYNRNCRTRLTYIEFMEGYFNNLKGLSQALRDCSKLKRINRIPKSASNLTMCFYGCSSLNMEFNLSEYNIDSNGLSGAWQLCSALTHVPILPTNYTGGLQGAFYRTKITTAPVLPDGVTKLDTAFKDCSELTTVGNIPSKCTNYNSWVKECRKLTSVPETGYRGDCTYAFYNCQSLNQKIDLSLATNSISSAFQGCSSLTITPILPEKLEGYVASMDGTLSYCSKLKTPPRTPEGTKSMTDCYNGCTSLVTAPYIPDTCTNIKNIVYACDKLTEITIPLKNISIYVNALYGTGIQKINWVGKRKTDFSIYVSGLYGGNVATKKYTPETLTSLVNDHLDDLYKDKVKMSFGDNKITINNTDTTVTT